MDTKDLGELAVRTRQSREAGIAILIGSALLAVLVFVPLRVPTVAQPAAVIEALPPNAYEQVEIIAQAGVVYDLATGETLFAKNAEAQLPLASLIKLLTVEAAVRFLPPDLPITITAEDAKAESPRRFKVGDTLSLRDMARLTLTASLNDGAAAIVRTIAERQATTTSQVLQNTATALDLTSTYAVNGNGLDVSATVSGGYGSARDMALLAGALVHDAPDIASATTEPSASATTEKGQHYQILNTNPTVTNAPRLLLSKTGFTDLAGGNLVLVFDAAIGHPIAVVVLGSTEEERFTDVTILVSATLAHLAGIASL